jgi:hypothetical protein
VISAPLCAILGKVSAILAACDPPDIFNGSTTTLQRNALNSNPTFIFRSGNPQVFHIGAKKSGNVRESVVRIAIRFL